MGIAINQDVLSGIVLLSGRSRGQLCLPLLLLHRIRDTLVNL
jgi:hypothetical protein